MNKVKILICAIAFFGTIGLASLNAEASVAITDLTTGTATGEMSPYVITDGNTTEGQTVNEYSVTLTKEADKSYFNEVVPVNVPAKGRLSVQSVMLSGGNANDLNAFVCRDAAGTQFVSLSEFITPGIYYINYQDYCPNSTACSIKVSMNLCSGEDRTLSENKYALSSFADYKTPVYYKVEAKKWGRLQ